MSAKNRKRKDGSTAPKPSLEFYPTPISATLPLFQRMSARGWLRGEPLMVDPCAGEGAIIETANAGGWTTPKQWTAFELRDGPRRTCADTWARPVDALTVKPPVLFDWAILNPPFSRTMDFLLWSLEFSKQTMLLTRLGWLASIKRSAFFAVVMPDVFVLSQRPSFTGDSRTDGTDYCWLYFEGIERGRVGRSLRRRGSIEVLPPAEALETGRASTAKMSAILSGGYIEWTPSAKPGAPRQRRLCTAPNFMFRRAEDLHRLELFGEIKGGERPAWTIVVRGPIRRPWGFQLADGTWQHWKAFVAAKTKKTGERNGADGAGSFDGEGSFATESSY